jgi:hypothetical protein
MTMTVRGYCKTSASICHTTQCDIPNIEILLLIAVKMSAVTSFLLHLNELLTVPLTYEACIS